MPIIKSAMKRVRQTAKRRSHNVGVRRAIHKEVRAVTDAITATDAKQAQEALRKAISEIDRAVKKGTLHANTAARRKSRLNAKVKAAFGDATKPTASAKPKTAAKPAATKATAAKKPAAKKPAAKPAAKPTVKKPAAKKAASK